MTEPGRHGPTDEASAAPRPSFDEEHGQRAYDLRFDWGIDGLHAIGPGCGAIVVVDVLRFTTAVSVAVARGAEVLPYVWGVGDAAAAHARRHGAELAGRREAEGWSLSPADLLDVPAGTRLVLPSPNGSTVAFGALDLADDVVVLAGCLRNAAAVAEVAARQPGPVAVIAAGERWHGDLGSLRPAAEDIAGAGAVLAGIVERRRPAGAEAPSQNGAGSTGASRRRRSPAGAGGSSADRGDPTDPPSVAPEAAAAIAAFAAIGEDVPGWLASTASGRELVARGWADDVAVAAALDADRVAPVLGDAAFAAAAPGSVQDRGAG